MSKKPKLTREEVSRIRADNARRGAITRKERGTNRGGRPKGSPNKNPSAAISTKTLSVREPDYQIFVRLASVKNVAIVEFMHLVAASLKAKNPKLFSQSLAPQL